MTLKESQDYREGLRSKESAHERGFRMGLGVCFDVFKMFTGEIDPETEKRKGESEKTGKELFDEFGFSVNQRQCFDTQDYFAEPRKKGWQEGVSQGEILFRDLTAIYPNRRASELVSDFEESIENAKQSPPQYSEED